MLVVTGAWGLPGLAVTATTGGSATPAAMATPSAEPVVDWTNGAEPIWTFETGTDYWADRFPPAAGGVFGMFTPDSDLFRVFDAETFEQLWTWDKGTSSYSWRPTDEAFFIRQGSQLTARNPRSGRELWTYTVPDEEWDWTTHDYDSPRRFVYITTDERLTVLDLASGDTLLEANRAGENIYWETDDGIMSLRNGNLLSVVDLDAGKERWRYRGPGTDIRWDPVDDYWYVTSGGALAVIDPSTGEERWSFAGSGDSISWTRQDDALYVRSGRDISALDPGDGTESWRLTASDDVDSLRTLHDMLVARSGATVSAIDPNLGVELWRYSLTDADDVSWGLPDDEDALYVYGGSALSVLDVETGSEIWRFPTEGNIDQVRVDDDTFTIVTGAALISVDASTGVERWRYTANAQPGSLSAEAGRFTFIANDTMYAVDASTGGELWQSEALPGAMYANLDTDSGTYEVTIDGADDALIDAESGETVLRGLWEERDGVLYNRTGDQVTAYDLDARDELWRYSADTSSMRFYLRDAMMLVVSGNTLVALDRESGTELWEFDAQSTITTFAMDGGVIRLTDMYGTLYALGPKPIQLEAGGTAMTTEAVTLRGAPNASAVERATLPAGTAVTITGESDEQDGVTWWPVTTGEAGEQGWTPAHALEPTANAPTLPSTPAA